MNLPEEFVAMLASMGLGDAAEALVQTRPEVSVRFNPRKGAAPPPGADTVPWWPGGCYLPERPVFTLDPRLHQGLYYVQEASSMIHARIVAQIVAATGGSPLRVLDGCAAPGGKSTAAIDALPDGSVVVANEFVPQRAAILRENIVKWGYPGVIVTRGDTSHLSRLREAFDVVIADVPCSGEGMMRKDEQAVAQWSRRLVADCAALQREIVANLWPALRPGGYMIYSTCTFNTAEDEENVAWIADNLGGECVAIHTDPAWGITPAINRPGVTQVEALRFIPGRTRGEGLFVALIRKPGEWMPMKSAKKPRKSGAKPSPLTAQSAAWLENPADYDITLADDTVTAFPSAHADLLATVARATDIIYHGIKLADVKGRDLIPAQGLALSTALRRGAFAEAELDHAAALDYLRGLPPQLPASTPRGFVLLTHGGTPLGFAKNIGSRANNLYPTPWRIKNL